MNYVLPSEVEICEVAPRDGFQAEKEWIPTSKKVEIIRRLAASGITSMEITSFVHPKAIPQLKDAEEVIACVNDLTNIKFRALIPNKKGAERAINAGIKKVKLLLSATDSHSLSNANSLVKDVQESQLEIVELANKKNVKISGSIAVAFGCPYEGQVSIDQLHRILQRYSNMGVLEVSLADTTGMANPKQVFETLGNVRNAFPHMAFSMHFHNTRGMAFANVIASMQQGITNFDSSIAGLGGCPYAPGASGNIASEDLVHSLHEMDVKTGIHLPSLLETARFVKEEIGHDGGSFVLNAGPCSQLHEKPSGQEKLIQH
ncbi:hydroxymethylglutaryl-CoA lyase [Fictibacillus solisalsi]|uniref:Hydroxymethylglutaryl-CoA lyase n=1 Tax=Fictibacillus solisalsi TaxID=459525 RepID=A0A1G9YCV8_9BACL|nr:hydroxymethylglutaryl-CoA lyase [Fictibacillus solisalsi]SDN06894.1 hydroxymethylglutaryl-CoA lyase [Fictibacillus solisalsi]